MSKRARIAFAATAVLAGSMPCGAQGLVTDDRGMFTPEELSVIYRHSPLHRLPPDPTDQVADDQRAVTLGRYLFFDTRFSANGMISCASCHQPSLAFTDGRALAVGVATGTRNSPTLLNAAFNQWYFLDGRSDSLWSQALQPLENPKEIAGDRLSIIRQVAHDSALKHAYEQIFGALPADAMLYHGHARPDEDPQSPENVAWQQLSPAARRRIDRAYSNLGKALEAYERRLLSLQAPFDNYVAALRRGDAAGQQRISPAAKRGLKLFVGAARCELCHSGPLFTDGQFHNLGLPNSKDPGRSVGILLVRGDPFNALGAFSDAPRERSRRDRITFLPNPDSQQGAFKTPSLREIEKTAPYMHDGRFQSLADVVRFYTCRTGPDGDSAGFGRREGTLDLIARLSADQQEDLVEFLRSLTGTPLPGNLTQAPSHL